MDDKPFAEALTAELTERDWSQRELARRVTAEQGWGSHITIARVARGDFVPSIEGIEAIAKTMRISPKRFVDYRMAVLRRDLDPGKVGFKKALATLRRLT